MDGLVNWERAGEGSLTGRHMRSHCARVSIGLAMAMEFARVLPCDVQCGLLAQLHGGNALVPTCVCCQETSSS